MSSTDAQIAERLVISGCKVNTHLTFIYSKLGIKSRAAATRWALEHQLIHKFRIGIIDPLAINASGFFCCLVAPPWSGQ